MKNSNWQHIPTPAGLPAAAGVYVVFSAGEPIYVGSAVNAYSRFYLHFQMSSRLGDFLRSGQRFYIKYRRSIRYGDWAMVELRLIRRLQPPLNTAGKRGARTTAPQPRRFADPTRRGSWSSEAHQ